MRICFVASHGGHLAEAMVIARGLRPRHEVFFVTDSDLPVGGDERVHRVAGFVSNPLKLPLCAWQIARILRKERPGALLSTGAEVALPSFLLGKLLFGLPTVYVECSARVSTPSRTGRLVYPLADLFLVQWEQLLGRYGPKAVYRGGLI